MSRENVEIVRRAYEVLSPTELARLGEFFAPDVEFDLSRNVFNPVTERGHEGAERLVTMVNEVWDDFRFEVTELIDAGDHVVATVKLIGKGKGSGVPVDQEDIHVLTVSDGSITRLEVHHDRAEALKAARLSE